MGHPRRASRKRQAGLVRDQRGEAASEAWLLEARTKMLIAEVRRAGSPPHTPTLGVGDAVWVTTRAGLWTCFLLRQQTERSPLPTPPFMFLKPLPGGGRGWHPLSAPSPAVLGRGLVSAEKLSGLQKARPTNVKRSCCSGFRVHFWVARTSHSLLRVMGINSQKHAYAPKIVETYVPLMTAHERSGTSGPR